jgi:hypothetical protein
MQLIFFTFLIFCSFAKAQFYPTPNTYFINGCRVFNNYTHPIEQFPGDRCLFRDNGDFISSNQTSIKYYTKENEIKWEIKNPFFHHQMNWSTDKQHILAMGSDFIKRKSETKRVDLFLIIDLNGKILKQLSAEKILSEDGAEDINFPLGSFVNLPVKYEITHFNSFYEIPILKNISNPDFLKNSKYILNSVGQGIFLLDKNLEKVHYKAKIKNSMGHTVHDAQVTSKGSIIFFNNLSSDLKNKRSLHSTVEELSLPSNKVTTLFKAEPQGVFFSRHCGGVQFLTDDLIFFSHHFSGAFFYSRSQKDVLFSDYNMFKDGDRLLPSQQIKIENLADFFDSRKKR